jgi:hypothetical protein
MRPWDYHRDLTRERLILLAQLLARGRAHALDRYDPEIGDDTWTRGVCAFNYGRFQITRASGTPGFEWLSVPDRRRRFQFRVGEVMMRFYRGQAESPKANMLFATELEQLLLPLDEGVPLGDVKFRLAVETDWDGSILQVSFVAIRGDAPETIWVIPYEAAPPLIVEITANLPQEVEIEPAEISFFDDEDEGAADDAAEG